MSPRDQTEAAVVASLNRAEPIVDTERHEWATRAIEYYQSILRQEDHLKTAFAGLYDESSNWPTRPKACYNLTRAVVSSLATTYQDPVRRVWPSGQEQWGKAWGDVRGFDRVMQDVDAYEFLTQTVGVRPIVMSDGKVKFAIYTSNQVDYFPEPTDPTEAQQINLSWKEGTGRYQSTIRHLWTAREFMRLVNDEPSSGPGLPNGPHDYGRIPIVWFRSEAPRWSFFGVPASDLIKANLTLNKLLTDLNWTVTWQTAGQAVIKGAAEDYVPKIGPGRYTKVDKDGSLEFANPNADIEKAIATINLNLHLFLASRRIPESAIMARQAGESGIALVAQASSLADWRKQRINAFRDSEAELIQLTLEVIALHKSGSKIIVPAPQLTYREFKSPMSTDEQATWDWKFQNGLATRVDYLMSEDPTLAKEDAQKKLEENDEVNRKRAMSRFPDFTKNKQGEDENTGKDKGGEEDEE